MCIECRDKLIFGHKKNELPLSSCPPTFSTEIKNKASTLSYIFKILFCSGKSTLGETPERAMLGYYRVQAVVSIVFIFGDPRCLRPE